MGLGKAKEETYIENNGPSGFLNTDTFKHRSSEMKTSCMIRFSPATRRGPGVLCAVHQCPHVRLPPPGDVDNENTCR